MTTRDVKLCEICGLVPPRFGVGFLSNPKATPGLPESLRGATLQVCDWPACERTATARALRAARAAGVEAPAICRTHSFPPKERA